MDKEEAFEFLRQHQPMPDTLTEAETDEEGIEIDRLLAKWDEVCEYFIENPDEQAIPLFFNSLGDNDGCGLYQRLIGFLMKFEPEIFVPYFIDAFNSPSFPMRCWAAEFAMDVVSDDPKFINSLISLLADSEEEVRVWTMNSLFMGAKMGQFNWRDYETDFRKHYHNEKDSSIREDYEKMFNLIDTGEGGL